MIDHGFVGPPTKHEWLLQRYVERVMEPFREELQQLALDTLTLGTAVAEVGTREGKLYIERKRWWE